MQLVLAAGGAGVASWGVSSGVLASSYFGMSTVGLGWGLGSMLGSYLFAPKTPDMEGPRLSDKSVQGSAYGTFIPIVYGRMRVAGNIIWATDLVEVANEEDVGGKGGGGSSYTTYTYFANFAVALCEGELDGIRKIWADGKLIYNKSVDNDGYTGDNGRMTFYKGTETQEPDAFIESKLGVGNVPAYRGIAYCVFDNFELTKYGNRIPNLTFEVVKGVEFMPNVKYMNTTVINQATYAGAQAYDRTSDRFWYVHSNSTTNFLKCYDFETGNVLYNLSYPVIFTENGDTATSEAIRQTLGIGPWACRFPPSSTTQSNTSIATYANNRIYVAPHSTAPVMFYYDADTGAQLGWFEVWGDWQQFIAYDPYYNKIYLHGSNLKCKIAAYDLDFGLFQSPTYSPVAPYPLLQEPILTVEGSPATGTSIINFAKIIVGVDPTTQEPMLDSHVIVSFAGSTTASCLYLSSEVYILGYAATQVATITHNNPLRGVCYSEVNDAIAVVEDAPSGTNGFTIRTFTHDNSGFNLIKEKTHVRSANVGSNARIFYHNALDLVVVAYNVLPFTYVCFINPISLEILYEYVGQSSAPLGTNDGFDVRGLAETNTAWMLGSGSMSLGEYSKVPTQLRITAENAILGDIVSDIAQRAGLTTSDIDVESMTEEVTGYVITKQAAARAALEPLMTAYFYDAVES